VSVAGAGITKVEIICVGGIDVHVGGIGVHVGGILVAVGGTRVAVGGLRVAVGGTRVLVGICVGGWVGSWMQALQSGISELLDQLCIIFVIPVPSGNVTGAISTITGSLIRT